MTDLDPLLMLDGLGVRALSPPTPVTGGADSAIWRVETPDGSRALRVLRPEQAHAAAREVRVLAWLAGQGFPVPRVDAHGQPAGRPALLLDWVAGEPLAAALFARPEAAARLGTAFGETQARLHALTPPPDLLDLAAQLTVPGLPAPERPALLHLDYHPLNVLVQGETVSGVIDWSNLALGDPRADVARSLSILSVDPAVWRFKGPERAGLLAFRRAYLAALPVGLPAALAWAGTSMQRDLAWRLSPDESRRLERWTAWWRARG